MANLYDPTSLAGGQVNINQPGDQATYTPGQAGNPPATGGGLQAQVQPYPSSVAPVGPVNSPANVVKGTIDQIIPQALQNQTTAIGAALDQFVNAGSPLLTNAARRGQEVAAARGLGNSSIAAGASQRAALEQATPFVQQASQQQFQQQQNAINQALGLQGKREEQAFQGEQSQKDRDLRQKLQDDQAKQQDWLNDRSFQREFNSNLSTLPIKNAFELNNLVAKYALENPEVYSQNVVSGFQNFFQNNINQLLKTYFPSLINVK